MTYKPRICTRCKQIYTPSSSTQEWCDNCLTKICEECGKPFRLRSKTHINRAKFCSVECKQNNWKKTMIGEKAPNLKQGQRINNIKKICKQCGKEYLTCKTHYKTSFFCCNECFNNWKSENQVGENSTNWKGGISEDRHKDMQTRKYVNWRDKVFERDNYTCQYCGDNKGGNLNAHHIKYYAKYPELRYEVDNGITLCNKCHRKVHKHIIELDIQSELQL